MATDVTMDDMDIDFDEDPEIAQLQAAAEAMKRVRPFTHTHNTTSRATQD